MKASKPIWQRWELLLVVLVTVFYILMLARQDRWQAGLALRLPKPYQTQIETRTPAATERIVVLDLVRPPLDHERQESLEGMELARRLEAKDQTLLPQLFRHSVLCFRQPFLHYQWVLERKPQALEELAPFIFLWPALPGEEGHFSPAKWRDPESYVDRPAIPPGEWLRESPGFGLALEAGGRLRLANLFETAGGQIEYQIRELEYSQRYDDDLKASSRELAGINALTPEALEELLQGKPNPQRARHKLLREYRQFTRDPDDARVAAAAKQLMRWIHDAAYNAQSFPATPEDAAWYTCQVPVNLDAEPDKNKAEICIGWDSNHAYRFQIRYPSGVREDTVISFTRLSVEDSAAESAEYPYVLYQQAFRGPYQKIHTRHSPVRADYIAAAPTAFQPWAQYRLAEHPALPRTR